MTGPEQLEREPHVAIGEQQSPDNKSSANTTTR
jgi:hypothetical protein